MKNGIMSLHKSTILLLLMLTSCIISNKPEYFRFSDIEVVLFRVQKYDNGCIKFVVTDSFSTSDYIYVLVSEFVEYYSEGDGEPIKTPGMMGCKEVLTNIDMEIININGQYKVNSLLVDRSLDSSFSIVNLDEKYEPRLNFLRCHMHNLRIDSVVFKSWLNKKIEFTGIMSKNNQNSYGRLKSDIPFVIGDNKLKVIYGYSDGRILGYERNFFISPSR